MEALQQNETFFWFYWLPMLEIMKWLRTVYIAESTLGPCIPDEVMR